jgi:hypothetical protein
MPDQFSWREPKTSGMSKLRQKYLENVFSDVLNKFVHGFEGKPKSPADVIIDEMSILERQAVRRTDRNICTHLKGGAIQRPYHRDYAVTQHTYPDGRVEIKCMICGQPWTKDHPDWAEARRMMEESSNNPTASEIWLDMFKTN